MRRLAYLILSICFLALPSWAAVKSKTVDYSYGGKAFKGYLAWDDAVTGKRPGILVVHEFWGLNDYAKSRVDQLAALGYVAFAADLYGDGKVAQHPEEGREMMGAVRGNLAEWMGRANAALKVLREQPNVDPTKLAAIGYCFGGATVLNMAYAGDDLKLVASFHGALTVPVSTKDIKAKILIFHGGKDEFISADTIEQLKAALSEGKVDYQFTVYPDAVHSFTVPGADKLGMKNIAYNAEADRQSWQALQTGLQQVFGQAAPTR